MIRKINIRNNTKTIILKPFMQIRRQKNTSGEIPQYCNLTTCVFSICKNILLCYSYFHHESHKVNYLNLLLEAYLMPLQGPHPLEYNPAFHHH